MDIFSAPAYRISPLARQAFSGKQKLGYASEIATEATGNASATGRAVAEQATQMAVITRIEIARLGREQKTASAPPNATAGAAQYQRIERATAPAAHQLSEYA